MSTSKGSSSWRTHPVSKKPSFEAEGYVPLEFHALRYFRKNDPVFELHEGRTLSGSLIDAASSKGIAHANRSDSPHVRRHARTSASDSANGNRQRRRVFGSTRFRLAVMPFERSRSQKRTIASRWIELPTGHLNLINGRIELPESRLVGRVVRWSDGQTHPGCQPLLSMCRIHPPGLMWRRVMHTHTDEDGRFEFASMPWESVMVHVDRRGYPSNNIQPKLYPLEKTSTTVALYPERSLTVRVLDVEGNPAPEIAVAALDGDDKLVNMKKSSNSFSTFLYTGPDGKVVLRGLPARRITLHLSPFRRMTGNPVEVDLRTQPRGAVTMRLPIVPVRETRTVRFSIRGLDPNITKLAVRVQNSTGQRVGNLDLEVRDGTARRKAHAPAQIGRP